MGSTALHFFAEDRSVRDERCTEKDAIVSDVIARLSVGPDFRAVLMPAAHGPEVRLLQARGVPLKHMYAIEANRAIRQMQIEQGLCVPVSSSKYHDLSDEDLLAHEAIELVPFEHVNFCYLDFFGTLGPNSVTAIVRALNHLVSGSCLLVTVGVKRGHRLALPLLTENGELQAEDYLTETCSLARHLHIESVTGRKYRSIRGTQSALYITTEIRFK